MADSSFRDALRVAIFADIPFDKRASEHEQWVMNLILDRVTDVMETELARRSANNQPIPSGA